MSVTRSRARSKGLAAADYILIWLRTDGRVQLVVEHMPIDGAERLLGSWKLAGPGRYRRTCALDQLSAALKNIGDVYRLLRRG